MNKNLSEKQFYYKLATEEEKSTMTIQLLPIDFACRVIRLYIFTWQKTKMNMFYLNKYFGAAQVSERTSWNRNIKKKKSKN